MKIEDAKNDILKLIEMDNYNFLFVLTDVVPTEDNLNDIWAYILSFGQDRTNEERDQFFNDIRNSNYREISFESTIKNISEKKNDAIERTKKALDQLGKLKGTTLRYIEIAKDNRISVNGTVTNKETIIDNMLNQLNVNDQFTSTILSTLIFYSGISM